jgi:hypothetical protein
MKLGRNKLCWCGSNIKYKKCHLNRALQTPVQDSELHRELNRFNTYKKCSVPSIFHDECSKKIVKAHSISKSSSLKEIAVDGHVLTFFMAQRKKDNTNLEPIEVGINKASIFNGFCEVHDKKLFSPFEDKPFNSSSYHCFLIMYRTISRELFVKESSKGTFGLMKEMDKGKELIYQEYIQERYQHFNENNDLTISDLSYMKSNLDKILISQEYNNLEHFIIELETPPKVMASAIGGISFGFDGSLIQDISQDPNVIPDYLCTNSFSSDGKGYIVLSWLIEHKVSNQELIETLKSSPSIPDSILMLIISHIENVYISPVWWNDLSDNNQRNLTELYKNGAVQDTYNDVLITNLEYGAFDYSNIKCLYTEHEDV